MEIIHSITEELAAKIDLSIMLLTIKRRKKRMRKMEVKPVEDIELMMIMNTEIERTRKKRKWMKMIWVIWYQQILATNFFQKEPDPF
jgi:hypothetical protein